MFKGSPLPAVGELSAQSKLSLEGMGRVGSAALVFLVILSIEQSISQRHRHKNNWLDCVFLSKYLEITVSREAGSAG